MSSSQLKIIDQDCQIYLKHQLVNQFQLDQLIDLGSIAELKIKVHLDLIKDIDSTNYNYCIDSREILI